MCRITGIYSQREISRSALESMRDSMSHGGPDSANLYINQQGTLGLGHRRLSIIDLSDAGNQPMKWNQWVLCFNGEVYNYKEIREQLAEYSFSTQTDTEVVIKAIDKWGMQALDRFRGMFAFALFNEQSQELILARDRMGVKPMYIFRKGGLLLFASELKAFHQHPDFDREIDNKAVHQFLSKGYIASPKCIYKHVQKLNPGSYWKVGSDLSIQSESYWSVDNYYKKSDSTISETACLEELEHRLSESFNYRMVADVPVGVFLSGGIDSSLVTALIQKERTQSLKTFTIGFDDEKYNEAIHAKRVSDHLGTDHHELILTESDFRNEVDNIPKIFDEPFGSASSIPTVLLSRMTREHVKVSLSADGGDEIFGGYSKYLAIDKHYKRLRAIPGFVKSGLSKLMIANAGIIASSGLLKAHENNLKTRLFKYAGMLKAASVNEAYESLSRYASYDDVEALFSANWDSVNNSKNGILDGNWLSYLGMKDMKTFLDGEVLTKVDRATMSVALEGRDPFLDQSIVEFGLGLPDHLKIRDGKGKYLLRQILYKYVPQEVVDRPKHGFDIPIRNWLKGFLKNEVMSMAADKGFARKFGMDRPTLNRMVNDFYKGKINVDAHFVWFALMLYKWYLEWEA